MRFSSSSFARRTWVLLSTIAILFACERSFAQGPIIVRAFPPPEQMEPVDQGITMKEFAALRSALDADTQLTQNEYGPVAYQPSQFGTVDITPVQLGSLGRAFVVYFGHSGQCGATANCPMALYVSGTHGYYDALSLWGWGFAIVPSGSAVPFVVSAANSSCCENGLSRFRFEKGRFVADICEAETTTDNWADPKNIVVKPCKPDGSTFPPPLEWGGFGPSVPTYHEMKELQPLAEADLESAFGPHLNLHFLDLPAVQLGDWLVLGVPNRENSGEMRLFVYPRVQDQIGRAVLRNVVGDAVAETDASSGMVVARALVILRVAGPDRKELTQYVVRYNPNGMNASSSLVPSSCESATPKRGSWPSVWNFKEIRVHAVPCSEPAVTPASAVVDGTPLDKVEQDGSGTVWAITPAFGARLVKWEDGQWSPVMGPVPNEFAALGPGPSGGVRVSLGKSIWLYGNEKKALPGLSHTLSGVATTLRLSDGGALSIFPPGGPGFPSLGILGADGNVVTKYDLNSDEIRPSSGNSPCLAPFSTISPAANTTWIWTAPKPNCAGLRGFIITDGDSFKYQPEIQGLPDKQISALGAWPGNVLAAAVPNDGVFLIDPRSLTAHRLSPPPSSTFQLVAAFFRVGADGYVIEEGSCSTGALGVENCDPVWRWSGGQWQLVIAALDRFVNKFPYIPGWIQFPNYFDRPSTGLVRPEGLWLGAVGTGIWLIPASGAPRNFTPSERFPLYNVDLLFELPNNWILAIHNSAINELHSRSVAIDPAQLIATGPARPRP